MATRSISTSAANSLNLLPEKLVAASSARILAGYSTTRAALNGAASIDQVFVRGNWTASSISAGVRDATRDGFGRNDALIDPASSTLGVIVSVTIQGNADGTAGGNDHFGITAATVGMLKIHGATGKGVGHCPFSSAVCRDPHGCHGIA